MSHQSLWGLTLHSVTFNDYMRLHNNLRRSDKHCSIPARDTEFSRVHAQDVYKLICLIYIFLEVCNWQLFFFNCYFFIGPWWFRDTWMFCTSSCKRPQHLTWHLSVSRLTALAAAALSESQAALPQHPSTLAAINPYLYSHLAWREDRLCWGIRRMALEWHMWPGGVCVCVCVS